MNTYIETRRTRLRTVTHADLESLINLMNRREIAVLTGEVFPMTEGKLEEYYVRNQQTTDRIWFVIEDQASGKIIGETGFLRIFTPWRTADFSLMIGDTDYWNQGYGKEIAMAMLDYGFNYLNFHRVAIGVVEKNTRAMKFWHSLGFLDEGRQKDGFFSAGQYSDFVMMHMLEEAFRQRS